MPVGFVVVTMDKDWNTYRKRPVEIEAKGPLYDTDTIETLEGDFEIDEEYADKGYFIIEGVHGERYPCKAEIFHETYQRVSGERTSE